MRFFETLHEALFFFPELLLGGYSVALQFCQQIFQHFPFGKFSVWEFAQLFNTILKYEIGQINGNRLNRIEEDKDRVFVTRHLSIAEEVGSPVIGYLAGPPLKGKMKL